MQRLSTFSLGLLTVLPLVGCGDDKNTSSTETTSGSTVDEPTGTVGMTTTTAPTTTEMGTTTSEPTTSGSSTGHDTAADGEPCTANDDCASLSCVKFTDNQTDAVCEAAAPGGNTRFTGTVFHFITGAPVPMADLRVVGALSALQDPMGATGLVTATSDAMGIIDATSAEPLNQGLGVVGLISGADLYITATGLAAPFAGTTMYPPLNGIHDIWGVPAASLTEWTGYLMTDPDPNVVAALPLGDNGGVIGLVRDAAAGTPLAGGVVKPEGGNSKAIIRYLNEDGKGFNPDMTGSSGIFVLLAPGLAEKFTVDVGGVATGLSGTAGSAKNAAFVLIFNAP